MSSTTVALTFIALHLCAVAHLCTASPISKRLTVRCSNNYVKAEAVLRSNSSAAEDESKDFDGMSFFLQN